MHANTKFTALTAALLLLAACSLQSTDPKSEPSIPPGTALELLTSLSTADREIIRADNGFGWKLFARLADAGSGNLFISPVSVSMALAMTANGARGGTEAAMWNTLGHGAMSRESVNVLYKKLIPALVSADPTVKLTIANAVWSQQDLPVQPDFIALNRESFGAETRQIDFRSPSAVGEINQWASEKTNGLIPEVVKSLPPDLIMTLMNALYFKGRWSTAFDAKRTYDGTFKAPGGDVPCRMMQDDTTYLYHADERVQVLQLPYGDSLFSMVLMLPAENVGVDGLAEALAAGAFEGWVEKLKPVTGPIHVPKFKLAWGTESLKTALEALGMGPAFSDAADFTGINPQGSIRISDVLHKAVVNVDEEGTEAAAVTVVEMVLVSLPSDLIRLDRPFLFAIREKNSGAVLFMGRVAEPKP